MINGYARCSTNEDKQDIQRQTSELKAAGAQQIFLEYEHGDSVIKEQLSTLLETAEAGDKILTLEVSRLARSTKQLCEIIEIVKEKKLCLSIVGSITVDCTNGQIDPMTNAFIQISGVFAELELRIIRERVRSGMRNSAAKGVKIGRPRLTADDIPSAFLRHYPAYKASMINLSELTRICNLSKENGDRIQVSLFAAYLWHNDGRNEHSRSPVMQSNGTWKHSCYTALLSGSFKDRY